MSRRRLLEADGVLDDLAGHVLHIEDGGQPDAAARLLVAYAERADQLCVWPASGKALLSTVAALRGVRFVGLPAPFSKFQLFYLPEEEAVRVLAVLHGSISDARRTRELRQRR